jgi:hypothetical protein
LTLKIECLIIRNNSKFRVKRKVLFLWRVKMKKDVFCMVLLGMVLALGMVFIGCDSLTDTSCSATQCNIGPEYCGKDGCNASVMYESCDCGTGY